VSRGVEAERLLALVQEVGERVGTVMKDVIPPEAQQHLVKAQHELITALFLIYQHQAAGRPAVAPRRRRAAAKPASRVRRIELDDRGA
jgi:hypothetical protein